MEFIIFKGGYFMKKVTLVVFFLFLISSVSFCSLDDGILSSIGEVAIESCSEFTVVPIQVQEIAILNPYFSEVNPKTVFEGDFSDELNTNDKKRNINLLRYYGHAKDKYDLDNDYIFFSVYWGFPWDNELPFAPENITINDLPVTNFFITFYWLRDWAYYGTSGCTPEVDVQLLGFAKVEGLSKILDGRDLKLKIRYPCEMRCPYAEITFTLSPQLEKYINFIGL
jgi:hypothetical protein